MFFTPRAKIYSNSSDPSSFGAAVFDSIETRLRDDCERVETFDCKGQWSFPSYSWTLFVAKQNQKIFVYMELINIEKDEWWLSVEPELKPTLLLCLFSKQPVESLALIKNITFCIHEVFESIESVERLSWFLHCWPISSKKVLTPAGLKWPEAPSQVAQASRTS